MRLEDIKNEIDAYLKKGLLKRQNVNFKQVEKQIIRAKKDLETAQLVLAPDPEWGATIAYQAMLRAGRALLFSRWSPDLRRNLVEIQRATPPHYVARLNSPLGRAMRTPQAVPGLNLTRGINPRTSKISPNK